MKSMKYLLPILIFASFTLSSCSKDDDDTTPNNNPPTTQITQEEKDCLIFMREEEKLARDVYLYAFDLYGMQIFSNIANSEQTHMDKILELLNTYGLSDPASSEIGVFNNVDLQTLYNELIAKCDSSRLDAFTVGATIEDVDIKDLDNCLLSTDKVDIIAVYENLSCGSRNHMRAFSGQIDNMGGSYTPQFITEDQYLAIINTPQENCGQ